MALSLLDGSLIRNASITFAKILGLQAALDGKANSNHNHAVGDITNLQSELNGKAAANHGHAVGDVSGLSSTLDGITTSIANRVRFDAPQGLTAGNRIQARSNILAAPIAALAYQNILVNPEHRISQEHGSNAVTANSSFATDQWVLARVGSLVASAQRVTDAPPGYPFSLRVTVTTAQTVMGANDVLRVVQAVERSRLVHLGLGTANARSSKLAGWVKASVAGNYTVSLRSFDTGVSFTSLVNIPTANVWQYVVIDVPAITTGTWGASNEAGGAWVSFALAEGSAFTGPAGVTAANRTAATGQINMAATLNSTFQFTGWAWLPGDDVPTADTAWMMQRHESDELRICHRYYATSLQVDSFVFPAPAAGYAATYRVTFPTRMRITPAFNFAISSSNGITSLSANSISADMANLFGTASTATNFIANVTWTANARM